MDKPLNIIVEERIEKIFEDLAHMIGDGEIDLDNLTEDEIAGIPFELFFAGEEMKNAWRKYLAKKERER